MSKVILVVGGNAAGPAAAAKAKRTSPGAEVILFEKGEYISTGTCELPYLFSGEIDDYKKLIYYSADSFRSEKGVSVKTKHKVTGIFPKDKKITVIDLEKGREFEQKYDSLILATGSAAKKIPGLEYSLKNVFTFKNVYNYLSINDYFKLAKVKNITIIGAGYIGLELSESLSKAGFSITLIDKENLPLSAYSKEISKLTEEIIIKNKIRFIGGASNISYIGSENVLKSINCDGRIIETDMLITCLGFTPNNFLAEKGKLKTGSFGGLITDTKLRTSDFSIFAAGDNIEVKNFITNKYDYIPSASFAHSHGHIAGENAAGGNAVANSVVKNISLSLFGSFICQVGITEHEAELNNFIFSTVDELLPNLVKVMPGSRSVYGKLLIEKRNKYILGAQFLGGREVSGYADIISAFIKNKIPAEKLSEINYNYTPALSPFVNILSSLGKKAKKNKVELRIKHYSASIKIYFIKKHLPLYQQKKINSILVLILVVMIL